MSDADGRSLAGRSVTGSAAGGASGGASGTCGVGAGSGGDAAVETFSAAGPKLNDRIGRGSGNGLGRTNGAGSPGVTCSCVDDGAGVAVTGAAGCSARVAIGAGDNTRDADGSATG